MKHTFQWLLAVVCFLVVGNASVMADGGEKEIVPIPISTGEVVTGNDYNGTNVFYQTTSDDVVICISRHNYIPYITNSDNLVYIQNEVINNDRYYSGNTIKVGKNVTEQKAQGNVIINQGSTHIIGKRVELQAGTKVSQGAILEINNP